MRATRIVQRNKLKQKVKLYRQALLGAKHLIDNQAEQLRKHDPGSLIVSPTAEQIVKVSR
jgi:hypothetical protein